jgi:hypothetical protein
MLDLPGFVLAWVQDFYPEDACILRLDKCRFKIQPRVVAALAPQLLTPRLLLELELSAPLLSAIQSALQNNDQVSWLNRPKACSSRWRNNCKAALQARWDIWS